MFGYVDEAQRIAEKESEAKPGSNAIMSIGVTPKIEE